MKKHSPLLSRKIFLEKDNLPLRLSLFSQIEQYTRDNNLSAEQNDALASVLAKRLGIDYNGIVTRRILTPMTPEEVKSLDGRDISVQLHTHTHRAPTKKSLFLKELDDNARSITSMRPDDTAPIHFCYPNNSYDSRHISWLKETGIRSATTGEPQLVSRTSPPLRLPRLIDVTGKTELEFEGWLSGFSALLPVGKTL